MQPVTIIVRSYTSGASWVAERLETEGKTSRRGFRADEGLEHGRRDLAEAEAGEIAARLGGTVRVWPVR